MSEYTVIVAKYAHDAIKADTLEQAVDLICPAVLQHAWERCFGRAYIVCDSRAYRIWVSRDLSVEIEQQDLESKYYFGDELVDIVAWHIEYRAEQRANMLASAAARAAEKAAAAVEPAPVVDPVEAVEPAADVEPAPTIEIDPRAARMAQICRRKYPAASIDKVDTSADSVFFRENGRPWVMIFDGRSVVCVVDMTPDDDIDKGAWQDEQRYNARCDWGRM
jgi:hypothetical protein